MRKDLRGRALDEIAIERLLEFADRAVELHPDGYRLCYSGGKDSGVILDLAMRSGVKFHAVHNLTTVDPPELVWHVRKVSNEVHPIEIVYPPMTMWDLIRKKKMPPMRTSRYCCQVMKERGGERQINILGVRWQESARRSKRPMFERCDRDKGRWFMNPIIDWTTADVWEYHRERNLPYCCLYDDGWKRVGCVLCPMVRDVARHMARWPKLCAQWERVVKETFDQNRSHYTKREFASPEDYWKWWIDRDASQPDKDQCMMFEDADNNAA